jgi:hypothetical protein
MASFLEDISALRAARALSISDWSMLYESFKRADILPALEELLARLSDTPTNVIAIKLNTITIKSENPVCFLISVSSTAFYGTIASLPPKHIDEDKNIRTGIAVTALTERLPYLPCPRKY